MTKNCLIEIQPKVPAQLLKSFLKGIGCQKVNTTVNTMLETWVDFEFMGCLFKAHRDFEEWRFFADNDCPPQLVEVLAEKIRTAEKPLCGWWVVCKGIF
ncbi:MAG: hypothetical protein PHU06_07535 [Gallionella sp.]|nr:hypothetical protein [Gallionella sp.]MDD4959024.1 hypothetical protein [Gallionella sp.]